jgi:hypothetical protein
MKPISDESLEEENGIIFIVVRVNMNSREMYDAIDFVKPGHCKVILKIDNIITKTHYFKNGVETSKEKIFQDERINQLKR